MTEALSVAPQVDNNVSILEKALDWVGQGQTAWGLLILFMCIIVFMLCLISFRKNINRTSRKQIDDFIKAKKYTPELYVELNENMEFLRYFIFSYRWKCRIVRRYNLLFKGYVGKQLKQAYKKKIRYKISCFSRFKTVKETITSTHKVLIEFRDDRTALRETLGDFYFLARNLTYDCINVTEELLSYCSNVESKNILIVGSAGNGKTSLFCRTTETAIKNKFPCLLINSKDINKNVVEYILEKLPLVWKIKNYPRLFLRVVNCFLLIQRKNLFILIDAVNENDSEDFLSSIGSVCDYFSNYSRVRIAFSCRSEYFECRYKKLFGDSEKSPTIFQLHTTDYDQRAVDKFFLKYSTYYKVAPRFSANIRNTIRKSLLLMRIFFEVNSGRPYENLEFQNAEIYKQYIDKVASDHTDIDVKRIIGQISSIMIDSGCYDKVDLSKLDLSSTERNALFNMLDNNLIINKTIQLGVGLSERTTEFLYFIFDEFRDFCIARELVIRDEDNADKDYLLFFDTINHMCENTSAPLEGILKYGYYYFKKTSQFELSHKILSVHGKTSIQQDNFVPRYHQERSYYFDDFGLSLIYMNGSVLQDYEYEYICDSLRTSNRSNVQVFFFLLNNEMVNEKPNLCQYLDIVFNETDKKILDSLSYQLVEEEDSFRNSPKLIDAVYKRIDFLCSDSSKIPENIKMMLILIFALSPSEWYWKKTGEPIVFENALYDYVASKLRCEDVKLVVQDLKERNDSPINGVDRLMDFLSGIYGK